MQELKTWAARSKFSYSGNVIDGTSIIYGYNFKVNFSAEKYSALLSHFKGRTVAIGTSRDCPPKDSVGDWIKQNVTKTSIASYVGPILVNECYAEKAGRSEIHFLNL